LHLEKGFSFAWFEIFSLFESCASWAGYLHTWKKKSCKRYISRDSYPHAKV
jgi:hypothetical protein